MKNLFGTLAAGMLFASAVVAAPIGNTSAPLTFEDGMFLPGNSDYSLRLGYSANVVADRKLQLKSDESNVDSTIFEQTANATISMFNRVDAYARLGNANLNFIANAEGTSIEFRTADAFIWALGGRVVLYNWDFTTLALFGEYSRFKATVNNVITFSTGPINLWGIESRVRQWDLGLSLSQQIDYMSPYVAVKYSDAAVSFRGNDEASEYFRLEARGNFGAAVGCTFHAGKKLDLSVEGRFIDEKALAFTGQFRF